MAYAGIKPAAPLDAFVERLWVNERGALPHSRERLLPTGRADVVIALFEEPLLRFGDEGDADGSATRYTGGLLSGAERSLGAARYVEAVERRRHPFSSGRALRVREGAARRPRRQAFALEDVWGGFGASFVNACSKRPMRRPV